MVNKVTLLGRVGKDPVVKHFDNGGVIAEFTLATDDSYKDKQGNKVEQTDWHNCKITFGKLAEVAEKYVKKGQLLWLEGKIKTRSYDDKDGNKKYLTEVIVESFKMLGGKDKSESTATVSNPASEVPANTAPDSDLPF